MSTPKNITAFTPNEPTYPPYVSINDYGEEVGITVRAPKWHDPDVGYDKCGQTIEFRIPWKEWARMVCDIYAYKCDSDRLVGS